MILSNMWSAARWTVNQPAPDEAIVMLPPAMKAA